MKFNPFKMAQVSAQWPTAKLQNMHSSNPEPFTWDELHDLIGLDPLSTIKNAPLSYASTQGSALLREIIIQNYHKSTPTVDDVVLTSGAQEGIFLVMHALLNPGDQVICFSPCFEPLFKVAEQTGADVSLLPLDAENNWRIDWSALEATINHSTQLLVINFPHNPTGAHISTHELLRLIRLCEKHDCWLFSDEVFRGLEHDKNHRLPAAADLYVKAISMGVMSKSLALPGIRLGWLTLQNKAVVRSIMNIKSYLSICQSTMDTQLCEAIIPYSDLIWQRNQNIINHNKQWLNQHLIGHDELHWQIPQAAATGFIQFKNLDSSQVSDYWANSLGIAVMPNKAFLTSHSGFRLTMGKKGAESFYQQIIQADDLSLTH